MLREFKVEVLSSLTHEKNGGVKNRLIFEFKGIPNEFFKKYHKGSILLMGVSNSQQSILKFINGFEDIYGEMYLFFDDLFQYATLRTTHGDEVAIGLSPSIDSMDIFLTHGVGIFSQYSLLSQSLGKIYGGKSEAFSASLRKKSAMERSFTKTES